MEAAALVVVGCVRFATGALLCLPCWFLPPGALTGLLLTSDSVLLVKIPVRSGDVQVIQTKKKKLEANRNSHRTKKTCRSPVFNLIY